MIFIDFDVFWKECVYMIKYTEAIPSGRWVGQIWPKACFTWWCFNYSVFGDSCTFWLLHLNQILIDCTKKKIPTIDIFDLMAIWNFWRFSWKWPILIFTVFSDRIGPSRIIYVLNFHRSQNYCWRSTLSKYHNSGTPQYKVCIINLSQLIQILHN